MECQCYQESLVCVGVEWMDAYYFVVSDLLSGFYLFIISNDLGELHSCYCLRGAKEEGGV